MSEVEVVYTEDRETWLCLGRSGVKSEEAEGRVALEEELRARVTDEDLAGERGRAGESV